MRRPARGPSYRDGGLDDQWYVGSWRWCGNDQAAAKRYQSRQQDNGADVCTTQKKNSDSLIKSNSNRPTLLQVHFCASVARVLATSQTVHKRYLFYGDYKGVGGGRLYSLRAPHFSHKKKLAVRALATSLDGAFL